MKFNWHRFTRKSHRYLGIVIGIQFLAWTIGGLYFSWTDLNRVHGSDLIGPPPQLNEDYQRMAVETALHYLEATGADHFDQIKLIPFAENAALYRIQYQGPDGQGSILVDAATGKRREGLTQTEAENLARFRYIGSGTLARTRLIEATGPHDEYRELPLPAYAFTFDDDRDTTIYVAPDHARVTSVRNGKWRVFDFLWMMHTMDYEGRDNFNNLLLKSFSILGLITIISGFLLFFLSSPLFRKRAGK